LLLRAGMSGFASWKKRRKTPENRKATGRANAPWADCL